MKQIALLLIISCLYQPVAAQFAPQAGIAGSTAIKHDDTRFVGWATGCTVQRGWLDIADKPQGSTTLGADANAIGKMDNTMVSLGDSGIAVLTFESPIYNGEGPDFAVFENGFVNPADPEEAFLELAFVEVSSDGVNYVRFPASSETGTPQVPGAGVYMNARKINNLAGKYKDDYGTPFDLEELKGIPELDINNITHIRLVDVIGDISANGTTDKDGHFVNDPYPTPYPSGGFDLDAVGALYMKGKWPTGANIAGKVQELHIYPNPAKDFINISLASAAQILISDMTGQTLYKGSTSGSSATSVNVSQLSAGVYYINVMNENGTRWTGKFSKY